MPENRAADGIPKSHRAPRALCKNEHRPHCDSTWAASPPALVGRQLRPAEWSSSRLILPSHRIGAFAVSKKPRAENGSRRLLSTSACFREVLLSSASPDTRLNRDACAGGGRRASGCSGWRSRVGCLAVSGRRVGGGGRRGRGEPTRFMCSRAGPGSIISVAIFSSPVQYLLLTAFRVCRAARSGISSQAFPLVEALAARR